MGWLAFLLEGFARMLKVLLGTDKPMVTEVKDEKPKTPLPPRSDSDLLRDLGIKRGV